MLWGIVAMVVVAFLGAYLSLQTQSPQGMTLPVALAAIFVGSYLCAFLGAKQGKKGEQNPFVAGLVAGGMFFALVILVSLFVPDGETTAVTRLAPVLALLAAILLGSLTAAVHRPSGKRKMKKLLSGRR